MRISEGRTFRQKKQLVFIGRSMAWVVLQAHRGQSGSNGVKKAEGGQRGSSGQNVPSLCSFCRILNSKQGDELQEGFGQR